MLEENVYEHFTNADFRKLLTPEAPKSLIEDLTFQIINTAIEQARKKKDQEPELESTKKKVCKPNLGYDLRNVNSLHDLQDGKVLFDTVFFMLTKCDRD